jgi:hypothetical protein
LDICIPELHAFKNRLRAVFPMSADCNRNRATSNPGIDLMYEAVHSGLAINNNEWGSGA